MATLAPGAYYEVRDDVVEFYRNSSTPPVEFRSAMPDISADNWTLDRIIEMLPPSGVEQLRESGILEPGGMPATPLGGNYYMATRDHPFLDMSEGARSLRNDAEIMRDYLAGSQPPPPFASLGTGTPHKLPLPTNLSIDEIFNSVEYQFAYIIGSAFSTLRYQHPYEDPTTLYSQPPIAGRAVPSGGSRHPSEAIITVRKSPSVAPGRYHFATENNSLVEVPDAAQERSDSDPLLDEASWNVSIDICMMVERGMYRYRDPRSFRALPVDAGHVDAQLASFAAYCNWHYESQTSIDMNFGESLGIGNSQFPRFVRANLTGGF